MNNISIAVALATAPSTAFADLRERPRFWFPLLLVVLVTAGLAFWYYSVVDIEWLKDAMFGNNPDMQKLDEEKRAAMMGAFGRKTLLISSLLGTCVFIPLVLALEALYLLLVAKVTKLPQGFKHWFALVSWCSLPSLLGSVVAAIMLVLSDTTQISSGVMQALSLNELLLHVPMGAPGYALFESLSIPALLSWALMIIGIRTWSQRSWAFSFAVVLVPCVVLYGIAAFVAFR